MSVHSMLATCDDCGNEFYIDMEYHTPESLKSLADTTECPECHSRKWTMGDSCER